MTAETEIIVKSFLKGISDQRLFDYYVNMEMRRIRWTIKYLLLPCEESKKRMLHAEQWCERIADEFASRIVYESLFE